MQEIEAINLYTYRPGQDRDTAEKINEIITWINLRIRIANIQSKGFAPAMIDVVTASGKGDVKHTTDAYTGT
jgi:hypothetical protein